MKIYTRTGDKGTTGLIGGSRVSKSDPRIECTGDIDELNAAIGVATAALGAEHRALADALGTVQNELFVLGALVAAPHPTPTAKALPELDETMITRLEMQMDAADAELPPLKQFILPGGGEVAARLHFARTVCRRAERQLVRFSQDRPVPPLSVIYLNRLSDWLFVQARWANHREGIADVPWVK
ncbi:MAG TPA: cob(I)yrinic acid a,c-diamide adenosyltransferase [Tepidisphaeraceae bacterium]|jgi:cob(I)alamin adenosyltransferase|nr:cob(I)yrinic acid a,c-diamide adenosyltransferase [Tepidisphaeraceae bacterium]